MDNTNTYLKAVTNSRLLNQYEKDALLDHPEELPEDYKINVAKILTEFDTRSQERQKEFLDSLQKAFDKYKEALLTIKDLPHERRELYLKNAEVIVAAINQKLKQFSHN